MPDMKNVSEIVCQQYASVVIGVPPGGFIWRFTKSADISARLKMETEPPQDHVARESGRRTKEAKSPKGNKKLYKTKHSAANEKRHLTGAASSVKAKAKRQIQTQPSSEQMMTREFTL
jgi:hypothetical protein